MLALASVRKRSCTTMTTKSFDDKRIGSSSVAGVSTLTSGFGGSGLSAL